MRHLFCVLITMCLILRLLGLTTHQPPHVATPTHPPRRWRLGPAPPALRSFHGPAARPPTFFWLSFFSLWRQQASQRRAGRTPRRAVGQLAFVAPEPHSPVPHRRAAEPRRTNYPSQQRREDRGRSTRAAVQKAVRWPLGEPSMWVGRTQWSSHVMVATEPGFDGFELRGGAWNLNRCSSSKYSILTTT